MLRQPRFAGRKNIQSKPRKMWQRSTRYTPYKRRLALTHKPIKIGQKGEGLFDMIESLIKTGMKAKDAIHKVTSALTGESATNLINAFPNSDENARPGYPGELHAVLKLPNGRMGKANYMGPGTQLIKRLKRGDPPRTLSDKVAQRHDIDYTRARSQKDVVRADKRMVRKLKQIESKGLDSKFNTRIGRLPIQAKIKLEASGLAKPGQIASFGGDSDPALTKKVLKKLEQQGFGVMMPGDRLKMALIKKSGKKSSKTKCKPCKKKGSGLSLAGAGLKLAGQGRTPSLGKLAVFTTKTILPAIINHMKREGLIMKASMKGSGKKLKALFEKIKGKINLKKLAITGAKFILPILVKMAKTKLQGSGLGAKISNKLVSVVLKGLKWYINSIQPTGQPKIFKGSGLYGNGFFKDFAKGFVSVFKKVLPVVKTVGPLIPLLL